MIDFVKPALEGGKDCNLSRCCGSAVPHLASKPHKELYRGLLGDAKTSRSRIPPITDLILGWLRADTERYRAGSVHVYVGMWETASAMRLPSKRVG